MQNLIALLMILMPMFVGFALPSRPSVIKKAEKGLNYTVFLILVIIGMELGKVADLGQKIGSIALYLGALMVLTLGFGSVALIIFEKLTTYPYQKPKATKQHTSANLAEGLIQPSCLVIGFVLIKLLPDIVLPKHSITGLLMVLLLLVGICLKGSGVNIKHALLNKYGLQMSVVFMVATLLGGGAFALLFDEVSIMQGLALASGFGWYSLSGTMMTEAYGVIWGSVALFNDLGRELLALLFIPYVMRYFPATAVGLGGVTSLDFTLPTITQSGGIQIAPLAVSFGFITNLVSPVLMVVFSAFS